ncbi:MAG: hypothetical protein JNL74_19490, partial [Fibrobacteres bacterium]|nr:hypothetical protein [Fibrobacterota bacterium]
MRSTLFLLLIAAAVLQASYVTLTENAGVNRNNEIVSVGIPLRMGEIPNQVMGTEAPLGISGIPAQFKVLSNWYDGSARFVLATFKQNFSSGESKQVYFGKGGGNASQTELVLTDRNDTLTINTGLIRVELLKGKKFNMVNRAWRGSNLIVDNSGSGGLIIKQFKDSYNDSLTFRGAALTDSFIVEESGPVRSCVYVVGRFYHDTIQMKASGEVTCNTPSLKQPPPYVRFMVRIYTFSGSDEIKITTVLHNSGQNGSQGTGSGSGGPFTFTLLDTMSKTFSLCEDSPQRLWFTEFYYDMKTAIGSSKTVTTENGVSASLSGSDRFSFLQGKPDMYYVFQNGAQTATGGKGMGYIDVKSGSSGIAAALKYCWEAYPKRLDVLGDTLRINLFPRDISPEKRRQQSLLVYSNKTPAYQLRFDSCYHIAPGSWYRSDVAFRLHDGNCNPA